MSEQLGFHYDETTATDVLVTTGDFVNFVPGTVRVVHHIDEDSEDQLYVGLVEVGPTDPDTLATVHFKDVVVVYTSDNETVKAFLDDIKAEAPIPGGGRIEEIELTPEMIARMNDAVADILKEATTLRPESVEATESEFEPARRA